MAALTIVHACWDVQTRRVAASQNGLCLVQLIGVDGGVKPYQVPSDGLRRSQHVLTMTG